MNVKVPSLGTYAKLLDFFKNWVGSIEQFQFSTAVIDRSSFWVKLKFETCKQASMSKYGANTKHVVWASAQSLNGSDKSLLPPHLFSLILQGDSLFQLENDVQYVIRS